MLHCAEMGAIDNTLVVLYDQFDNVAVRPHFVNPAPATGTVVSGRFGAAQPAPPGGSPYLVPIGASFVTDDYALRVDVVNATGVYPTGTLANGAETAVGAVAVSILAANAARKTAIVQNTGGANIRVGVVGVTATTGLRLTPGSYIIFEMPFVPTQALFAIREGGTDSIAFTQEIT